jgi:hypothetical protein
MKSASLNHIYRLVWNEATLKVLFSDYRNENSSMWTTTIFLIFAIEYSPY